MTNNLIDGAEETSSSVKKISESSIKQNYQIENIGHVINKLEEITEKNISDSKNLANNAVGLKLKSDALKEQMSFFKI